MVKKSCFISSDLCKLHANHLCINFEYSHTYLCLLNRGMILTLIQCLKCEFSLVFNLTNYGLNILFHSQMLMKCFFYRVRTLRCVKLCFKRVNFLILFYGFPWSFIFFFFFCSVCFFSVVLFLLLLGLVYGVYKHVPLVKLLLNLLLAKDWSQHPRVRKDL